MTKKMAASVTDAKERTKAAPLVGATLCLCTGGRPNYGGLVAAPDCPLHGVGASLPAPLSRIAYVAVRQVAGIFQSAPPLPGDVQGQYLDMFTLANTRASVENVINERQRIHATALRKGTIDSYLRVARIEIREVPEEEAS